MWQPLDNYSSPDEEESEVDDGGGDRLCSLCPRENFPSDNDLQEHVRRHFWDEVTTLEEREKEGFGKGLGTLFEEGGTLGDWVIKVRKDDDGGGGGECESFKVHKAILAARSPVFRTMLEAPKKKRKNKKKKAEADEVIVTDLTPKTMKIILKFIYSGDLDNDWIHDSPEEVLKAADKYGLSSLKNFCTYKLNRLQNSASPRPTPSKRKKNDEAVLIFTCRHCPGRVEFSEHDQLAMEEHRNWHRGRLGEDVNKMIKHKVDRGGFIIDELEYLGMGGYFTSEAGVKSDVKFGDFVIKVPKDIGDDEEEYESFKVREQSELKIEWNPVIITAQGESVTVHKVILASRSPVFKAVFEALTNEKETIVTDVTPRTMRIILKFIYTGELDGDVVHVPVEVIKAAYKYQLLTLEAFFSRNVHFLVTLSNALQIFKVCKQHDFSHSQKKVKNFIKSNIS